ncbi:MAG: tRNA (adenosine(37)-N6)-threonylcarbamoyltransferase complex transferase subunit TsaD, partial [Oscillospiraceae bacterium]|nr:tRNA (adenosine(37)-N6)-threonylcarbamoyltransferase complex transferase subunit TsaD [Oscillospiraceae bacterium]
AGRTARAAEDTGRRAVALAGGVAANGRLRAALREALAPAGRTLYVPPPALCGDNAAMIAAQAFYEWREGRTAGMDLNGYANACVAGCENF